MDKRFSIKNQLPELGRIASELEQLMLGLCFSEECRSDVQLICEEILCNIVSYGFPKDSSHSMEMRFVFDGQWLTLEFVDDGVAFDPLNRPDPKLDDPEAEDRPIGGLGIFLVKALSEQQTYHRRAGKNHLIIRRPVSLLQN